MALTETEYYADTWKDLFYSMNNHDSFAAYFNESVAPKRVFKNVLSVGPG